MIISDLRAVAPAVTRREALRLGVSRSTLYQLQSERPNVQLKTLERILEFQNKDLLVSSIKRGATLDSTFSIAMISHQIQETGSWKIPLFNFVDYFRTIKDIRLVLLPPIPTLDQKLKSLLASSVLQLSQELKLSPPLWARERAALKEPWFVSGIESLKATALRESPMAFKRNNIFVLRNFLERA